MDVLGGHQLVCPHHGVLVDVHAVGGQVAGSVAVPYMTLVVCPSWSRLTSLANILQATWTRDDIHNILGLA